MGAMKIIIMMMTVITKIFLFYLYSGFPMDSKKDSFINRFGASSCSSLESLEPYQQVPSSNSPPS